MLGTAKIAIKWKSCPFTAFSAVWLQNNYFEGGLSTNELVHGDLKDGSKLFLCYKVPNSLRYRMYSNYSGNFQLNCNILVFN